MTHICVGNITIIGTNNGLSSGRRKAIIWTNVGIVIIGLLGTNYSEIWIWILPFSFKKINSKMASAKMAIILSRRGELTLSVWVLNRSGLIRPHPLCHPTLSIHDHDDVMKWNHFPRYWPFVGEFTGPRWIPLTTASDAELWCFLWSGPEQTVE